MAAVDRKVFLQDVEHLLQSALEEVDKRYHSELSTDDVEKYKMEALFRLPDDCNYTVQTFTATSESKFHLCFATEDLNVDNIEGWLTQFQAINNTTLKVKTKKKPTKTYLMQTYYRCQHNTRNWSPSKDPQRKLTLNPTARVKNTNCPFQIIIKIDSCNMCTVDVNWDHNHETDNLEATNFKELSDSSIEKINTMFDNGETPSTARQQFLKELKSSCKDEIEFHLKKADRSVTPRQRDFRYLYEQYGKQKFGGKGKEMFEKLVEKVEQYRQENAEATVELQTYGGDDIPLLVAVVTPLMKRVHKEIPQSGELVFVDATSNTEEHNLKIFLLCTHCVAGALPCGLLITSNEKESTLKSGFEMLRNCLPNDAFFGRGKVQGPVVMLTDNCQEERTALKYTWPAVTLLLCIFHILQQVWRWLTDKKHNISEKDRPDILSKFKETLFARTEDLFEDLYNDLLDNSAVKDYEQALEYFKELYEEKEAFALSFRSDLPMRGNQTNNFVEAQFLVLKDMILRRTKEYNVVALMDKLTVDLDNHYKQKLLSIADGSYDGYFRRRFMGKGKTRKCGGQGFLMPSEDDKRKFLETVKKFPNSVFEVTSLTTSENSYMVDMSVGVCSCDQGADGSPCKHQYLIWVNNLDNCPNFAPVTCPKTRQKLAFIALGETLPLSYYTTLRSTDQVSDDVLFGTDKGKVGAAEGAMEAELEQEIQDTEATQHIEEIEDTEAVKQDLLDKASESLTSCCRLLEEKLRHQQDTKLAEGVLKFSEKMERLVKLMPGQLTSALYNFGSLELSKRKTGKKIKVQPNRKRKSGDGSRQAVAKGRPASLRALEYPAKRAKRSHNLAQSVKANTNVSKKSGSHVMKSRTRNVKKVSPSSSKTS